MYIREYKEVDKETGKVKIKHKLPKTIVSKIDTL